MAVVDKPWDGSPGRFSDSEYERSCVLDRKNCGGDWSSKPPKKRCSLPIKEPNGDINKNALGPAVGRIDQVKDACPSAVSKAKSALRSAYGTAGMPVPEELKENSKDMTGFERFAQLYGVIPGQDRHGKEGFRGLTTFQFRDDAQNGTLGTLFGHFAVFNRWTEIDSFWEGRFMESLAPGCFKKTLSENIKGMRCLVQHGRDPMVGMKPLGPINEAREDGTGAYYEVPLLDTSYNRDLLPGLQSGLFGASFRFQVMREEVNAQPSRSEHNPDGIEERRLTEVKVREFGPVTFPAYEDATAGVRSFDVIDELLRSETGEAGYAALTRSARYYHQLLDATTRSDPGSASAGSESESEREGKPPEGAPPSGAPDPDRRNGDLRTTRLSGAARPLRTSRIQEEPKWKL